MNGSKITPENGVPRKEKNQNIQVFVRVRPMNSQEHTKHAAQVVDTPGTREVVVRDCSVTNVTKTFNFDKVFGASSKQVDVYKTVVAPLLNEVLLGYNCTVFAYGQTGTGKTFTMEGERSQKQTVENDPLAGILPRALSQLFDEVRLMNCEFTVRVSFLELYNEELFDLLAPIEESKHKTLRLFEDSNRKGSVIIQGLEEVIVNNKQEVYAVLDRGSQQRRTAATLMNAHSSRSHTVFTITVHMKESSVEGEEMLKVGKLHLVDLAGSENIGKSGAVEKRAREAGSINQSLLTLGRVISALVERTPHIPYRESKLTRLLQDSLGGKTKTSIIATVSPANTNIEETLSTLDYAHRAKNIMNKPEVNQKLTKKEALNIYTDEIERLRRDLCATREKNGVFMDQDNYNRTMCQIGAQHAELNEKSNKIRELEELLVERETQAQEQESQIHELQIDIQVKQAMLLDAKNRQEDLVNRLMNSERRSDELKYLVKYHIGAEEKMAGEASNLLNTASDSVAVIEALHGRLERKQSIENRNWTNSERFREEYRKCIDDICDVMNELREGHTLAITEIRDIIEARSGEKNKLVGNFNEILNVTYTSINLLDNSVMELTDKLKDIVHCREAGVAEMMEQQHIRAINGLSERMKAITDSADSAKQLFGVLYSENKKLQQSVEEKFNRLSCDVKETLKNNNRVYDRLDVVLHEVKKKWGDLLNDGNAHFTEFKSTQSQYKDESNRKIEQMRETLMYFMLKAEGMQKTLDDLKLETNDRVDKSVEIFSQFVKDVDKASNVTDAISSDSIKSIQEARTASHNTITKFSTYKIHNVQEHKQKLSYINEKLENEANSMLTSMYETVTRTMTEQRGSIEEVIGNVAKTTKLYGGAIEDHRRDVKTLLGRRATETKLLKEASYNGVKVLSEGQDKSDKKVLTLVDAQCDHVSETSTTANSMLQHAAGNVDEFWEETYLVDTPSGGTPGRRKYDLPSKLTLPSPHSRVMARYRSLSKDVKVAIDDRPDDLNCSWSDGYFKNLKLPVQLEVVETDDTEAETEPEFDEGNNGDDNVENLDPSAIPIKRLDTIAESVEAKDASKNNKDEYADDVTPEQSQSDKVPALPETPKKKNRARRKSGGKKGVLKSTN